MGMMRVSGLLVLTILVAFMATSSLAVDPNLGIFLDVESKRSSIACCDNGVCALSYPPQCRCLDEKSYCHAACKRCRCTKSNPPKCRCLDVNEYGYAPCTCPPDYIISQS